MPFLGTRAALPPLGLLTVAAMLPASWELRLLDLNVEPIAPKDLEGVDLVFASAMLVQRASFERLAGLCREVGKPLVAGGPYPTSCRDQIQGVEHFVLGEAEVNLPAFLRDLREGSPRPCYADPAHPELLETPAPRYDLVDRSRYAGASLQFSRGCPHNCEFCDIVQLFGHQPRTKSTAQFLGELDGLHRGGWRGSLFIVDDNFIGHRTHVRDLLPALARWQRQHHFPFNFFTEASLDLAANEDLMDGMVEAGFDMVFVGIETPDQDTLHAIAKQTNLRMDLLASVKAIQHKGLEVSGGFILGFDADREDIFDRQIGFVEEAAIPTAMVGMLTALPGTRLHDRLAAEGRLLDLSGGGNNTHDLVLNFVPRMDAARLRAGYLRVLENLYAPRRYFARCLDLIRRTRAGHPIRRKVRWLELRAFFHSLLRQTFTRYGPAYWAYLLKGLILRPRMAAEIVTLAVKGHHFFTITQGLLTLERFRVRLEGFRKELEARLRAPVGPESHWRGELEALRQRWFTQAQARGRRIHPDLRASALRILEEFRTSTDRLLHPGPGSPRPSLRGPAAPR